MNARKLIVGGLSSLVAVIGVSSIVYAGVGVLEHRHEIQGGVPDDDGR